MCASSVKSEFYEHRRLRKGRREYEPNYANNYTLFEMISGGVLTKTVKRLATEAVEVSERESKRIKMF